MENKKVNSKIREFNVTVLSIPIVYNFFGDYDPNGLMYILEEDKKRVYKEVIANFNNIDKHAFPLPKPVDDVQPLTLRANVGDTIRIKFKHNENRRISIRMQGMQYKNIIYAGDNVGLDDDLAVGPGEEIIYEWYAEREGIMYFNNMGDTRFDGEQTNLHGLFGAVIVEAEKSTWTDPATGRYLKSGVFADVHNLNKPSFKEYSVYFHDKPEIVNRFGTEAIDPLTNMPVGLTAINYRLEPINNVVDGDEDSMSLWFYDDLLTLIPRKYKNDSSKVRIIGGGGKETQVFHFDNNQCELDSDNVEETRIDSTYIGQQGSFTIDTLFGSESLSADSGFSDSIDEGFSDSIYEGFSNSVDEEFSDSIDKEFSEIPEQQLQEILNQEFSDIPEEQFLEILNQWAESNICSTKLGIENFEENFEDKDSYDQSCFEESSRSECCEVGEECICECIKANVIFELFVLQAKIVYNNFGWPDLYGRFYASREQIEEYTGICMTKQNREELAMKYVEGIEKEEIDIEPLVLRASQYDCIEVRTTNFLTEMPPATGFKYGETITKKYYADAEKNFCLFHNHFNPNSQQHYELFGTLIIEPEGSEYYDPVTGEEIRYGTKAVIRRADGTEFREFGIFVNDVKSLFDQNGKPINSPQFAGVSDDLGVNVINYKCESLIERLNSYSENGEDPADGFSSIAHFDSVKPILETYPGEEIVIRLLDGDKGGQHVFNINGMNGENELIEDDSQLVQSQTLGISEEFNIKMTENYKPGDYIYYVGGQDDSCIGIWGIIRVYNSINEKLLPISYTNNFEDGDFQLLGEKTRKYHIGAIQKDIKYNRNEDHDSNGLLFVPYENKNDILNGTMEPNNLILRKDKGEYLKITLTNCFMEEIPYK